MASLHVFLRDTAQVVSVILTFWFWVTHILISEQRFPAWARFVLLANPLFYVVRAYRELLLNSRLPSARDLVIVAVYSSAAFVWGGLFFPSYEARLYRCSVGARSGDAAPWLTEIEKKFGAHRSAVPTPVIDPRLSTGGVLRAPSGFSLAESVGTRARSLHTSAL